MSGQRSRSRRRVIVRHRRGVDRELAPFATGLLPECPDCMGDGTRWKRFGTEQSLDIVDCDACDGSGTCSRVEYIERGGTFDVHAAREHASKLVALDDEQHVFEQWCLEWGWLADKRVFGRWCDACLGYVRPGGPCGACDGSGILAGGWPGKLARQWPGDRRAPMGRSYARLGRRILAALEGQPSACQSCGGWGKPSTQMRGDHVAHVLRRGPLPVLAALMRPCATCDGTGRNLRGALPPISPPIRGAVSALLINASAATGVPIHVLAGEHPGMGGRPGHRDLPHRDE